MPTVKWRLGRSAASSSNTGLIIAGRGLLRRQAVATTDHPWDPLRTVARPRRIASVDGGQHLEVQRLAHRTGLLGPVEHGDRTGRWEAGRRPAPRPGNGLEQPHPDHADPLAGGDQGVDGLLDRAGGRTHHDDDPLGVGRAVVVDQAVPATGSLAEARPCTPARCRAPPVERVGRLAGLEERRRGSGRCPAAIGASGLMPRSRWATTSSSWMSARMSSSVEDGDLVDLVAGAEAVEEVQERHPGAQRGGVGDQGEVVGLLHRAGGEHRPARAAGGHDVAVVTEDRQGVGGDGPGRDVDHRRRQLAGDLEHVRDHQQQALRRGERGGQRTLLERAVQRAGRAGLGLHLDHVGHGAPQVGPSGRRPVVGVLGHRRRRGDRVDRDDLAQGVGDPCRGLVAVHALVSLRHQGGLSTRSVPDARKPGRFRD